MSTESLSLLEELDALFGKTPAKATKAKSAVKPKSSLPPPPRDPRYWQPDAVVLYTSSWRCTCGETGTCAPMLAVREHCGRSVRHRSITRQDQFCNLPREIESTDPVVIHNCPSCFAAGQINPQLSLPFGKAEVSELALFIESGFRAAEFAEAITDPWNTSKLTPELRELRLNLILNLKENFHDAN